MPTTGHTAAERSDVDIAETEYYSRPLDPFCVVFAKVERAVPEVAEQIIVVDEITKLFD